MVSLEMIKGGYGIAVSMQLSSNVQVMKVKCAKHNGVIYHPHLVICDKVESEKSLFYQIVSVLIMQEKLLLFASPLFTVTFKNISMHMKWSGQSRALFSLMWTACTILHYPCFMEFSLFVPYCFLC